MKTNTLRRCYGALILLITIVLTSQSGLALQRDDPIKVMQEVNDRWMQDNASFFSSQFWHWSVYHIGNISQYKRGFPVETVIATETQDPNIAGNTRDDDLGTRWSADGDSRDGKEISITYDLGRVRPVSHLRIAWFRGDERMAFFDIQVSSDNVTWETVILNGESSGETKEQEIIAFEKRDTRYVKYIGNGNSVNAWNSITEFDITCGEYYQRSLGWAQQNNWQVFTDSGNRTGINGDYIACGQAYIELYKLSPTTREPSWIRGIDDILIKWTEDENFAPNGEFRGIRWIDGLFMVLPNFSKVGDLKAKGDQYVQREEEFYWGEMLKRYINIRDEVDGDKDIDTGPPLGLYSDPAKNYCEEPPCDDGVRDTPIPGTGLWWRDDWKVRPGTIRTVDAKFNREHWSRGNGWVIAAFAQILETLPENHVDREKYETDFKNLAATLKERQRPDGAWQMDLLVSTVPDNDVNCGETTGTAFFTYGLAWGINHDLLDRIEYEGAVRKAWRWLTNKAVTDDALLDKVQTVGGKPVKCDDLKDTRDTRKDRTQYAVGAFLLAGSEVSKLKLESPPITLPIKGSVKASDFQDPNIPENTIDDDLNTRWSAFGEGQWITYDLGSVFNVERVDIAWYRGDVRRAFFGLEASEDGTTWIPLLPNGTESSKFTLEKEIVWEGKQQARFLRYTGQGNTENNWVSITEVCVFVSEVAKVPPSIPVQSVTANRWQEPNVPANTIDDNLDTRWSCLNEGVQEECSIVYDLGRVFNVGRVEIAWYRGDVRVAFFGLEASVDGVSWSPLLPNGTASSGTTLEPETVWNGVHRARFLRYTGQGNTENDWVSITEFRVFEAWLLPVKSATANRWQEPNIPANTIDENLDTRWSCLNDGVQEECSIVYDLGSIVNVSQVEIAWYRGDVRMAFFGLEASVDGVSWTPLLPNGTASSGTTLEREVVWMGVHPACFLRYTGQGNTENNWVSVTEFRVFWEKH